MKYVICEHKKRDKVDLRPIRPKYVILFSDHLAHSEVVPNTMKAVSAGEVVFSGRADVRCSGKSVSLRLTPKSYEKDAVLISIWLAFGESMLIMASIEYDEA